MPLKGSMMMRSGRPPHMLIITSANLNIKKLKSVPLRNSVKDTPLFTLFQSCIAIGLGLISIFLRAKIIAQKFWKSLQFLTEFAYIHLVCFWWVCVPVIRLTEVL